MERAPLRPVPSRPPGPVDPAEAIEYVERALPQLDEGAVAALALVQLAGCSRQEAADRAGLPLDEAGAALSRARKELRRSRVTLPGSGWCERAERMISDRFDDSLDPPGPARLAVHLRNCPRCVEHERRLAQAIDVLVDEFVVEVEQVERAASHLPAPELAVVDAPATAPGPVAAPWRGVPLPEIEPRERPPVPEPEAEPRPEAVPMPEPEVPAAVALEAPAAPTAREPEPVPIPDALSPGPGLSSQLAWGIMFGLAVLLAVVTIVIVVLGALGGSL